MLVNLNSPSHISQVSFSNSRVGFQIICYLHFWYKRQVQKHLGKPMEFFLPLPWDFRGCFQVMSRTDFVSLLDCVPFGAVTIGFFCIFAVLFWVCVMKAEPIVASALFAWNACMRLFSGLEGPIRWTSPADCNDLHAQTGHCWHNTTELSFHSTSHKIQESKWCIFLY